MKRAEINSAIKAIYLQAAALAGLEVGPDSPEELVVVVKNGYAKVTSKRRPEAVANVLKLVAAALESAQERGDKILHEDNVREGQKKVCPVYPFGSKE